MRRLLRFTRDFFRSNPQIKIWYHPLYLPELYSHQEIKGVSIKYKTIIAYLFSKRYIKPHRIKGARRVSFGKLNLFHRPEYVESTTKSDFDFSPLGLKLNLGEGESLREAQRRIVSGTVNGMNELAYNNLETAINISGGLHHAEPKKASGFCLYNDIGVAIKNLRRKNFKKRILIIDLDFHQGNGNFEGLKDDPHTFHFSISGAIWRDTKEYSNVLEFVLPSGTDDQKYLEVLSDNLYNHTKKINPDLICYISGNDVLKDDPYGTFQLSLEGVLKRDQIIYNLARTYQVPLQIVIGGGYSQDAWKANCAFLAWILKGERILPLNFNIDDVDHLYTQYLNKWNPKPKKKTDDFSLDASDLFPELEKKKNIKQLFNYYTRSHVEFYMNKLGMHKKLKEKGHPHIWIEFIERSTKQNMLRLKSMVGKNTFTLVEALVEIIDYNIEGFEGSLKLLNVEWLLAQNPLKSFTINRPKLPGQDFPGLGLADEILNIFVEACRRFNLDGVIHCPTHYHVAIKALKHFHYPDPKDEGILCAIENFLDGYTLLDASLIMEEQRLKTKKGNILSIADKKLIYPVSKSLHHYFESEEYQNSVKKEYNKYIDQFIID